MPPHPETGMVKPLLPRCVLAHWAQGQCLLELEVTVCEGQGGDWDSAQIRLSLQTQILRKEEPMETPADGGRDGWFQTAETQATEPVPGARAETFALCLGQQSRPLGLSSLQGQASAVGPWSWASAPWTSRSESSRGTEPLSAAVTVTTTLKVAPPRP